MSQTYSEPSLLLSLPLELRNMIYLEVARTYVLNISARDRRIILADKRIENSCCAMHSKTPPSTATSLALVSHQIAYETSQVAFRRTKSPLTIYFSSTDTLKDFQCYHQQYQPAALRDLCLSSASNIMVKAPSAWQAFPPPGDCFHALDRIEVTGLRNVFHLDILRVSLSWDGWMRDNEQSDGESWTFLRVQ